MHLLPHGLACFISKSQQNHNWIRELFMFKNVDVDNDSVHNHQVNAQDVGIGKTI